MKDLTFNAIDVETANNNPGSICQIGIVHVRSGLIQGQWSALVNPEEQFTSIHTGIHGIDGDAVQDSDAMPGIYDELCRRLHRTTLISHSFFDRNALCRAFNKYGLQQIEVTWLDSAVIAKAAWPGKYVKKYNLPYIAAGLGIEFKHHDAAEDARVVAEIVLRAYQHSGRGLHELR